MNENKTFDRRVLAVLKDITKRNKPTLADCFVIESLLATADITTRVSNGKIYIYGGLETGTDLMEFLRQYRKQLKTDLKNKVVN